jgi:hypothetical protein
VEVDNLIENKWWSITAYLCIDNSVIVFYLTLE